MLARLWLSFFGPAEWLMARMPLSSPAAQAGLVVAVATLVTAVFKLLVRKRYRQELIWWYTSLIAVSLAKLVVDLGGWTPSAHWIYGVVVAIWVASCISAWILERRDAVRGREVSS